MKQLTTNEVQAVSGGWFGFAARSAASFAIGQYILDPIYDYDWNGHWKRYVDDIMRDVEAKNYPPD